MNLIIEQEKALHKVWFSSDKATVERLLHPEFSEVDESGRSHFLDQILVHMDKANHSQDKLHSQDFELINLQSRTMLLLYKSALLKPTGEYCSYAKRSSIWVELNGQWMMKYHQGTHCEAFNIIR